MLENLAAAFLGAGLSQIGKMLAIATKRNQWWGFAIGLASAIGLVLYLYLV